MSFKREQYGTLVERLREPPRTLAFVSGPRQSGKTTLIQQALAGARLPCDYVAADEPDAVVAPESPNAPLAPMPSARATPGQRDARWLAAVWERARAHASHSPNGFILALDEIQKVPNWSDAVKGLWDADRRAGLPLRVTLAGSAPLLMQQGLTESLAGRFEIIELAHWSYAEMAAAFDFDLPRYIWFGGYPKAAEFIGAETRWRSYVKNALIAPHIERDILAMQRIDKPALLRQAFELGTACSGQILAYNKMLGRLQDAGNTTTLARYEDLLRRSGLLAGLAKHQGSAPRRRASAPKWNTLNTALMTALADYAFEEAQADRSYWGRLVESAVGAHLCNTAGNDIHVRYWRKRDQEVDFVLQRGRHLLAIEVKSGRQQGRLAGLEAFASRFKGACTMIVGADGVPVADFLAQPAAHWLQEASL